MKKLRWIFGIILTIIVVGMLWTTLLPVDVRGKFMGIGHPITPSQTAAQTIAMADEQVRSLIGDHRSAVFGVARVGAQRPADSECDADCQQVNIYDFDAGATVVALVDGERVVDLFYQEYNRPMPSQALAQKATEIVLDHPDVIAELGFKPERVSMSANDGGMVDGCVDDHVCVAATFEQEGENLWAVVDLTAEQLAGLFWTTLRPNPSNPQPRRTQRPACPQPGSVERAGWSINYETTPSDGTAVYDVTFNGMSVLTSAKNVEWHVDYGNGGFTDSVGCGVNGGAFPVGPFGETEVRDLTGGFELVQDYRMLAWGENCAYRYEQRFQFYDDGRFQILTGAYGRGCGSDHLSDPTYRPILRIDIAVNDDTNNSLISWEDGEFVTEPVERWWKQSDSSQWKITEPGGIVYDVEPNTDDNAYFYITRHRSSEGDIDLGIFDSTVQCCTDSHKQGPNDYIDGDVTAESNLVLWYVPQFKSSSEPDNGFCWTEQGDPDPIVFPCFGGLMFTPVEPIPTAVTTTSTIKNSQNWLIPLIILSISAMITGGFILNRKMNSQNS